MSRPSDLVQGTLDLLILKILALQPLNGWAIGQRLKQVSGDVLQVSDGSLYPALHKLENEAGSSRSGSRARTIAAPSSTRSLARDGAISKRKQRTGIVCRRRSRMWFASSRHDA